jgi:hypothetical protein
MRPSSSAAHPLNVCPGRGSSPQPVPPSTNAKRRHCRSARSGRRSAGERPADRLCRDLGIDYPIWSAGFGGAGPELVAAVSGAGGFGVLGANGLPADAVTALVARTRELTDRPFGLNFIIGEADQADREALLTAEVRAATAAQVAAVVLFWGDPTPMCRWPTRVGSKSCSRLARSAKPKPPPRPGWTR